MILPINPIIFIEKEEEIHIFNIDLFYLLNFIFGKNLSWEKHKLVSLHSWLLQPSPSTLLVTNRGFTIKTSSSGRASTTSNIHQQRRATELESGSRTLSSFRITINASRKDFRATKLKWTILLISPQKNSEPNISLPLTHRRDL